MDRPLPRPLLPAPRSFEPRTRPSTSSSGTPLPPRRSAAIAACELCREKKAKCDSRRPSCGRCLSNGVQCHYTTKVNETLTQADKREKQRFKRERDDLLYLLSSIRDKPEVEARELFARIRASNDPFQVAQSLRHAELFLRDDQLMPPKPQADHISPESSGLPSDTSESEELRVPAKPWTTLVGDAVVSRLMTRFFLPDFQLFPAIDKDIFIADMRGKNSTQFKLCSALLVNAMCALPCFELATNTSLAELFLNNSKALLEQEYGRPSLPTALALYLLYITSTLLGRDRAGLHFRQMSVDMFGWLDLEERMTGLRDEIPAEALERRAISKVLWGMFVADSRTFLLYNRPPLLRPPSIPRLFTPDLPAVSSPTDASPMSVDGADGPANGGLMDTLCSLAEIQYTIALYEAEQTTTVGSAGDLSTRQAILLRWKALSDALSSQLRVEPTPPAPICYLSLQQSEVALSVLHPLPAELSLADDSYGDATVKDLFLQHAHFIAGTVEALLQICNNRPHYPIGFALYYSLVPLIPLLDGDDAESRTNQLFTSGCARLSVCSRSYPFFVRLLQGIAALAWRLGKDIPPDAREIFTHLSVPRPWRDKIDENVEQDIPIALDVPRLWDMRHLTGYMCDGKHGYLNVGKLGDLIAQWNRANLLTSGP